MPMIRSGRRRAGARLLGGAVCLLALAGCSGRAELPKTYPVNGKVIGKGGLKVNGAGICFESKDPDLIVVGDIQEDGSFTLKTRKGKAETSGAPEGEYRVTISFPSPADRATAGRRSVVRPITLPKPYKVEAKDDNNPTFEVERPRP
jgi:hypothetical protein